MHICLHTQQPTYIHAYILNLGFLYVLLENKTQVFKKKLLGVQELFRGSTMFSFRTIVCSDYNVNESQNIKFVCTSFNIDEL